MAKKTVLITGARRDSGFAIAEAFAREQASLISENRGVSCQGADTVTAENSQQVVLFDVVYNSVCLAR